MKFRVILILLFFSSLVIAEEGMRVTLLTPSVTFRDLIVGDEIENYIEFENKNDFNVSVKIEKADDLKFNHIDRTGYVLKPGDKIKDYYRIELTKPGNYSSNIQVIFSNDVGIKPKSFPLSAVLNFVNIKEPGKQEGNSGSSGGSGKIKNNDDFYKEPEVVTEPPMIVETEPIEPVIIAEQKKGEEIPEESDSEEKRGGFTLLRFILFLILFIILIVYLIRRKKKKEELQ